MTFQIYPDVIFEPDTWKQFLAAHGQTLVAADFLSIDITHRRHVRLPDVIFEPDSSDQPAGTDGSSFHLRNCDHHRRRSGGIAESKHVLTGT